MAVGVLTVLMVTGGTLIYYAGANVTSAERSVDDTRALALGEAGMNYARSILWNAADPTSPTAVPSGTLTLEGGTVTYSAAYDSGTQTWTITGTGTHASPNAGGGSLSRTVTSQVQVTGGGSLGPGVGLPLRRHLGLHEPEEQPHDRCAHLRARRPLHGELGRHHVRTRAGARQGADPELGVDRHAPRSRSRTSRSREAAGTRGAARTSRPCGTSQRVYKVNFSSTVPDITKPSVNLELLVHEREARARRARPARPAASRVSSTTTRRSTGRTGRSTCSRARPTTAR